MATDAALVGSGHGTGSSFTTTGGSVSAGDTLVFAFAYDPGVTISSVSLSNGDTLTQIANRVNGTGRLAVYIKQNATSGGAVTATANFSGAASASGSLVKCTGVSTTGYDAASLASGTDAASPYTVTSNGFTNANNVVLAILEQNSGSSGAYASSNFTVLGSESDVATYWTHAIAKLNVTAQTAVTPSLTRTGSSSGTSALVVFGVSDTAISAAATLSSPSPSGTLGTASTASVGASTNQVSGTGYVVLSTTNNVATATATQIKAGNNSAGSAASFAANGTISASPFTVGFTGLAASTQYFYAVVQNNANGDTNVVSGSFTTSANVPTISTVNGSNTVNSNTTGAVIAGANFGASQGAGKVYLCATNDVNDAGRVEQTVTAWGDTSVTISVVKGSLSLDTNIYCFVKANSGSANATGKVVQILARAVVNDTLIALSGAAVASLSPIVMLVWRAAPTTGAPNPNEAFSVSTNGSGQISQQITRGALAINDPVWVSYLKDGSPAKGTLRKITPSYV